METEILFSKLDSERKTGELLALSEDFYKQTEEQISRLEAQGHPEGRQASNAKKTLSNLKTLRTQKILIYLAYNKHLPTPIPQEEEQMYNQIRRILDREINIPKATKVKILEKVPEIVTTSGKKIGPFEKGEIVTPEKQADIDFIINNKIGEIVEQ